MKNPALRLRPESIDDIVAAKMPLSSRPTMPAGIVAIAIAKYDASCGFLNCGNVALKSGCVTRATIGGMNHTAGPMMKQIIPRSAALRAWRESLTARYRDASVRLLFETNF